MSKVIEIIDSDDDNNNNATSSSHTSSVNNSEIEENQQTQSRRRRRKSILHAMPDPDMQFQTISLEDEDDEEFYANDSNQINIPASQPINTGIPVYLPASASRTLLKTQKLTPKIPTPTSDEIVSSYFEKFLNDPETVNDLYAIAEERARINYLLSLNGMPEINFSLYARPDLLQLQFEQRIKQRKMVNNWDSTRLLENRRNVGQNNED